MGEDAKTISDIQRELFKMCSEKQDAEVDEIMVFIGLTGQN